MRSQRPGRRLMLAGAIVVAAVLIIVAVRELQIPRYWIPVLAGAVLFVAGMLRWLMAGRDSETRPGPPS